MSTIPHGRRTQVPAKTFLCKLILGLQWGMPNAAENVTILTITSVTTTSRDDTSKLLGVVQLPNLAMLKLENVIVNPKDLQRILRGNHGSLEKLKLHDVAIDMGSLDVMPEPMKKLWMDVCACIQRCPQLTKLSMYKLCWYRSPYKGKAVGHQQCLTLPPNHSDRVLPRRVGRDAWYFLRVGGLTATGVEGVAVGLQKFMAGPFSTAGPVHQVVTTRDGLRRIAHS